MVLKLDLGCGFYKRRGFVGIDKLALPGVDVVCDITTGLPYSDESADAILLSHSLEHIPKHKVLPLIGEVNRVLKMGGTLEIIVPDFEKTIHEFLSVADEQRWGHYIDAIYGNQLHPGEYHLTGFTRERLRALLSLCNFSVERIEGRASEPDKEVASIRVLARKSGKLTRRDAENHGEALPSFPYDNREGFAQLIRDIYASESWRIGHRIVKTLKFVRGLLKREREGDTKREYQ